MTPMIDVVFLLLVFFVWTSSFELPEYDLPGAIAEKPTAGNIANPEQPPPVEPFDEIVVKLTIRGGLPVILFGDQPIESIEDLRTRLSEVLSLGIQPAVIIDPEPQVSMERTIEAYDAARAAGADRVLYAVDDSAP